MFMRAGERLIAIGRRMPNGESVRPASRLRRIWPLAFSALALIGILHLAPRLYEDFKFVRDGVATYGWYTDLEQ